MAYTYKNPNQFEVTIQSPTGGALNVPYNGVVKGAFFAQYETAGILATVADPGSGYTFEVTDATAPLTNTLAIGDVFSVANQAARLALTTAEKGDIAVQADTGITYMLSAAPASTNGNWVAISTPTALPTVANEAADTSCFLLFNPTATGTLAPKTNTNLAYNSNTGALTLTGSLTVSSNTFSNYYYGTVGTEVRLSVWAQAAGDNTTSGKNVTITAGNAVAGVTNNGAGLGGDVYITAGNAARLNTGNGDGGWTHITAGNAIGNGDSGIVEINTPKTPPGSGAVGYTWFRGSGKIRLGDNALYITDTNGFTFNSNVTATQFILSDLNTAPANAGATGTKGEIRIAADYIYVCTATNTWVRAAIATW